MSKKIHFKQVVLSDCQKFELIDRLKKWDVNKNSIFVTVENYDGKHSDDQRKLFHALMRELSVQARNVGEGLLLSETEWKRNIIKGLFGMVEHKNLDGTISLEPRSSSDFKMSEYAELITFTLDFAAHHFDGEITLEVKK